jgi:hypothetical protein
MSRINKSISGHTTMKLQNRKSEEKNIKSSVREKKRLNII